MSYTVLQVGTLLRQGEIFIYPTETFYAIGCLATDRYAPKKVFAIKKRAVEKTLPLLIADWSMAKAFFRMNSLEEQLAREFWPGPLSLVLPGVQGLHPLVQDKMGCSAVRMTSHEGAQKLCQAAGAPLVSSSANITGSVAVDDPRKLDPEICEAGIFFNIPPRPSGGLPSTVVRVTSFGKLRVWREGALPVSDLLRCGIPLEV